MRSADKFCIPFGRLLRTKSSMPAAFDGTRKSSTVSAGTSGADGTVAHPLRKKEGSTRSHGPTSADAMTTPMNRWRISLNMLDSGSQWRRQYELGDSTSPEIHCARAE